MDISFTDYMVRKKQIGLKKIVSSFRDILCLDAAVKNRPILMDIGGAGPLKRPWSLLLPEDIIKISFDPDKDAIPTEGLLRNYSYCLSDRNGEKTLKLAKNLRSSSLQEWNDEFIQRFGKETYEVVRRIPVECRAGDDIVQEDVDFIDVNTEGHDYYVLLGLKNTLATKGYIVRIEFEFFSVYQEQGSYGQIERFMQDLGYELISLDMIDYAKERLASNIYSRGVILWAKMTWIKKHGSFAENLKRHDNPRQKLLKALIGNCLLVLPSHSFRILREAYDLDVIKKDEYTASLGSLLNYYQTEKLDKLKYFCRFPFLNIEKLLSRIRKRFSED